MIGLAAGALGRHVNLEVAHGQMGKEPMKAAVERGLRLSATKEVTSRLATLLDSDIVTRITRAE